MYSSIVVAFFRILVCKKDLKRSEEVLSELPVAVGPKQDTVPLCLGCLAPADASVLCDACGWPVCEPACAALPAHRDAECPIFAKAKARFQVNHDITHKSPKNSLDTLWHTLDGGNSCALPCYRKEQGLLSPRQYYCPKRYCPVQVVQQGGGQYISP